MVDGSKIHVEDETAVQGAVVKARVVAVMVEVVAISGHLGRRLKARVVEARP